MMPAPLNIERSTRADSGFGEIALVAPAETSYVATVEIAQDPLLPPRNLTIAVHTGNKFYLTLQRGSLNESEFIVETKPALSSINTQ
jgi:hypothetical protein